MYLWQWTIEVCPRVCCGFKSAVPELVLSVLGFKDRWDLLLRSLRSSGYGEELDTWIELYYRPDECQHRCINVNRHPGSCLLSRHKQFLQFLLSLSSALPWKINYLCCGTMGALKRQFTSSWQKSEEASWRKVLSEPNLEGQVGVRPIREMGERGRKWENSQGGECGNWVEVHVVLGT